MDTSDFLDGGLRLMVGLKPVEYRYGKLEAGVRFPQAAFLIKRYNER